MTHTPDSRREGRCDELRRLANRWQDDLATLDSMGLHIAAASLDGALTTVRRKLEREGR